MRVLVVEDNMALSDSVKSYLHREGYQCEGAATAAEAIKCALLHDYDCILLDISLPDGNGLKVLERMKQEGKTEGVIIISAKDSLDDRIAGLKLGADDYLTKPFHLSELSARIEALIRRRNFQGSNRVAYKELMVDVNAQQVAVNGTHLALTRKEYDLLLFMLSNQGKVVSKSAIAEHLSGDMADMLDNFGFVYAHIKNLKKKLAESGCGDYLRTIYGFGYQWQK